VPPGVSIALKNGWLPLSGAWEINSIGHIAGAGKNYVIAVLSAGSPSMGYGITTVEGVSSLVWRGMAAGSAIAQKWASLGGPRSMLGSPTGPEANTPDGVGRYQAFQHGWIHWTPGTGAHEVHGAIAAEWAALGFERSVLGYPVNDESGTPDGVGRYNHFQRGSIYWSPATGAHEVHGFIHAEWAGLGWERSVLGYPVTDEIGTPDGVGRFNHFQGGSIYWTPGTGAHELHGAIRTEWAALGFERSALGYPVNDESGTADGVGRYNRFQGGSIFWTPATGAHEVHGLIHAEWAALGFERSPVGYPVGDESSTPGGIGRYSQFQGGAIYWSPATGAHEVHGAIYARYLSIGGPQSVLGLPKSDEHDVPGGRQNDFEHGHIYWDRATNQTTVITP
jgi:uncharacterized protein with LGFP repeats